MEHSIALLRHTFTEVIITGEKRRGTVWVTSLTVGKRAREMVHSSGRKISRNRNDLDDVVRTVDDYLNGAVIDLSSIPVDITDRTPFQKKVLTAAQGIPYGTTCSYAQLAQQVKSPAAVRAVASVMRRNPVALIIPCHRIVRSDGSIGGYCGSLTGEDVQLKKRLLAMEAHNIGTC